MLAFLSGEPANVRLDKIFFLVNQLGSPLGHNVPGKNGFFCSGRVGTFPHEQAIFLGLKPQSHTICCDFCLPVRVCRFQIVRPFLPITMDGKEKLDLLFFVMEVVVLVGDYRHNLLFI